MLSHMLTRQTLWRHFKSNLINCTPTEYSRIIIYIKIIQINTNVLNYNIITCDATIKFKLSCDKQWLEVTEMNLTHNHETDQRAFHHLPQQRRLDKDVS